MNRQKMGYLGGIIGILGNLGIFAIKIYIALVSNSLSVMADAFHTLSDMGTSVVVILGFYFAYRKADAEHPFGHGRAEHVASFIVSLILILVGVDLSIDSYTRIGNTANVEVSTLFIVVLILTIVIKELMAYLAWHIGKNIRSTALRADAWHHHSDALTTIGVIIAVYMADRGYPMADTVMGFAIAILLIYIGIKLAKESVNELIGTRNTELEKVVREEAMKVNKIIGVHSIEVHSYGNNYRITIHVCMDSAMPLSEAHAIATEVERQIMRSIPNSTVNVHMEPASECDA